MTYPTLALRAKCILASVIVCANLHAQSSSKPSKAATAYASLRYSDAVRYFKDDHRHATAEQKSALAARIADCYWLMRNYDSAYQWYASIPAEVMNADTKAKIRLSDLLATKGNYAQAANIAASVPGFAQKASGFKSAASMQQISEDWQVQYLESVNTRQFREFSPVLVQQGLLWSSNLPLKGGNKGIMGWDNQGYAGLVLAADAASLAVGPLPVKKSGAAPNSTSSAASSKLAENYDLADFERSRRIVVPAGLKAQIQKLRAVSTPLTIAGRLSFNQAHAAYNPAAGHLYFSANRQEKLRNKTRTVGIAAANLNGSAANDVKFIFPDGKDHSLMHPAIHSNGSTLVFASEKSGGSGGFDLYVSERSSDGSWSAPLPLTGVNTAGNELFPTFGLDGKLYFSSDGRAGLGCLDIYAAEFAGGKPQNIRHLPHPVNSAFDDFGMAVQTDGKTGFFTSDRFGSDDIFKFMYEKKMIKVSGFVKSEATVKGRQDVEVILEVKNDRGEFQKVTANRTNQQGSYSFEVPAGSDYRVTYNDNDQLKSLNVPSNTAQKREVKMDDMVFHDAPPPVKPATEPAPVTTSVARAQEKFIINFDFDSYIIRKASFETLQKVKSVLMADPAVKCLIEGHTDAFGDEEYNSVLSKNRAEAVRKQLVRLGVDADRISIEAKGSTMIISQTSDRNEAQVNRRVEIKIEKP